LIDYEEAEPGHRHMSHLFGLHPGNQVTVRGTPELAQACRVSLDRRLAQGGGHTGWSRAWIVNFFARLEDGDKAHENLVALLSKSTLPNPLLQLTVLSDLKRREPLEGRLELFSKTPVEAKQFRRFDGACEQGPEIFHMLGSQLAVWSIGFTQMAPAGFGRIHPAETRCSRQGQGNGIGRADTEASFVC
jgi:hypothetical protein